MKNKSCTESVNALSPLSLFTPSQCPTKPEVVGAPSQSEQVPGVPTQQGPQVPSGSSEPPKVQKENILDPLLKC